MAFLDEKYLLSGPTSEAIYAGIRDLPIIDAHNHCDVKALSEDRRFTDLWEAEGATDHYVWECMRKCGVEERFLTSNEVSNEEKWMAMAGAFELLVGNPTYEWIHLDLKRRLGINEEICAANAKAIWDKGLAILNRPDMSQQNLIRQMKVEVMCSTDDPVDTLEYHRALQSSPLAGVVRPTFRPDRAMNIFKKDWPEYVTALEKRWNMTFHCLEDMLAALRAAHNFFAEMGCRASDHGVNVPYAYQVSPESANEAFMRAREGKAISEAETIAYMSYFLNEMAELDAAKGWVFQIHIGAVRDVRDSLLRDLGADVGGDISDHLTDYVTPLLPLLNRFDNRLKVVLYNMNPIHNATLAQLTRAFGYHVSLGLAWWLNDSFIGMKTQLEYVSSVDALSNMAGMVSDSRKILSYGSRHEMFRRTLAHVLGSMVDLGRMPMGPAERLARHLSYDRPKQLFGF
ncbi:MAG TPA: glucuronate isomerase [Lentisphaeria bacterium]|nr:glucuronate isomerase [Lentisphaeria bacterium]